MQQLNHGSMNRSGSHFKQHSTSGSDNSSQSDAPAVNIESCGDAMLIIMDHNELMSYGACKFYRLLRQRVDLRARSGGSQYFIDIALSLLQGDQAFILLFQILKENFFRVVSLWSCCISSARVLWFIHIYGIIWFCRLESFIKFNTRLIGWYVSNSIRVCHEFYKGTSYRLPWSALNTYISICIRYTRIPWLCDIINIFKLTLILLPRLPPLSERPAVVGVSPGATR